MNKYSIKTIGKTTNKIIGRNHELAALARIGQTQEAAIVIVHGRRRVGKTTLIEHAYKDRALLKIEGVEGGNKARQIETALLMLSQYAKDPAISQLRFTRWLEFFEYLSRFLKEGIHTLYLEELQWLASYDEELVGDFKLIWDNHYRKNPNLVTVLCGSSPSFMINKVIKSKALYGRSQHILQINPFTLKETQEYFGDRYSLSAIMDSFLAVGGIPEYLAYLRRSKSPYLDLCSEAFRKNGYFYNECERVFVSSMAQNQHYKKIIEFLAKVKFSTRLEIAQQLKLDSGGTLSSLLHELEMSGFIHTYVPYNKDDTSKLVRYEIADPYLQFYYRFIGPIKKKINQNAYQEHPTKALNLTDYQQWLGYSFERWCRHNHHVIAKALGFSAVKYDVGPFFSKSTPQKYQIDLLFLRADKVLTICEIKYTKASTSKSVIRDFERKIELLSIPSRHSVQRVLISAEGADASLVEAAYFDQILDLKMLL
jgi:AAA+ ATPase superfamily predicted ATPase